MYLCCIHDVFVVARIDDTSQDSKKIKLSPINDKDKIER